MQGLENINTHIHEKVLIIKERSAPVQNRRFYDYYTWVSGYRQYTLSVEVGLDVVRGLNVIIVSNVTEWLCGRWNH